LQITINSTNKLEPAAVKLMSNHRVITGHVATRVSGKVPYTGSLERDLIMLLDFQPSVVDIRAQTVKIKYSVNGATETRYTPDILATFRDHPRSPFSRPVLYEAKYSEELKDRWQELRPRFRAAVKACKSEGWIFKLITEKQIRGTYLDNVHFLRQFQDATDSQQLGIRLIDQLDALQTTTPSELLAATFMSETNRAMGLRVLWSLIANYHVGCDLDTKITMQSKIWSNDYEPV
jgi:hypothetical protein